MDDLAALDPLTIFAGAGVSADIGFPLYEDLMPDVLAGIATEHRHLPEIREYLAGLDEARRQDRLGTVIARIGRRSPDYLGSIARALATPEGDPAGARSDADVGLRKMITSVSTTRTTPGGFIARGLGALAFAMLYKGRGVEIITTNYDSAIIREAQDKLHEYLRELRPYRFAPVVWKPRSPHGTLAKDYETARKEPTRVPLFYANGKLDSEGALVVAEMDFLPLQGVDQQERCRREERRAQFTRALAETDCLFVGSSVTDPDMLVYLAETQAATRARYALILPPDMQVRESRDRATALAEAKAEYRLTRRLIERRFIHLGITPITLDFPFQVPQFLRELALKIQLGEDYEAYEERLKRWWTVWHEFLGFAAVDGTPGTRNPVLQLTWSAKLAHLRDEIIQPFLKRHVPEDPEDTLMVEVWTRNPSSSSRGLYLSMSSESAWLNTGTAHYGPINVESASHYRAQEAFRAGTMVTGALNPRRGHWKYGVSLPLILHKAPWHHLPIGVVNILSDREPPTPGADEAGGRRRPGRLWAVIDENSERSKRKVSAENPDHADVALAERFADAAKATLNDMFDTESPAQHLADDIARTRRAFREHERDLGLTDL